MADRIILVDVNGNFYAPTLTPAATMPMADSFGRKLLASSFNLLTTTHETPIIQVMFPYYVDTADDVIITVTGSGAVTQSAGMAVVTTGATANSTAIMETRRFIQYRPGQGVIARLSGFANAVPDANGKITAGILGAQDGFAFSYNGTALSVLHRLNTSDTFIAQASWNGDKVDGSGPSGFTWDATKGSPMAIQYQWLGVGIVNFFVYGDNGDPILIHTIKYGNAHTGVSLLNPCLPMRVEVSNGATATARTFSCPCLTASIYGDRGPANDHPFSGGAGNVSLSNGSETFVAAFFNKATFQSLTNRIVIQPREFNVCANGQRTVFNLYRRNASTGLTATSFANVDATNSCIQTSTAGTFTATGWRKIKSLAVENGGNIILTPQKGELPLYPGDYWVVTATAQGNGATGGVEINWVEER